MKTIVIASKNPAKISAAQEGFLRAFPGEQFVWETVSVPSDVAEQPLTSYETLQGAINRINNAQKALPNADFWIGIESGLDESHDGLEALTWVAVKSKDGTIGRGRSCGFFLPAIVVEGIKAGKSFRSMAAQISSNHLIHEQGGTIGLLTNNVVTRSSNSVPAVILALIPFLHPELFQ